MKKFASLSLTALTLVAGLAILLTGSRTAVAKPVVKMRASGILSFEDGVLVFGGTASHLGRFTGFAQMEFVPGDIDGTLEGAGVTVLKAADGDVLVGVVAWLVDMDGAGFLAFSWRDAITLRDGVVVSSTGRFVSNRPAGNTSQTSQTKLNRRETQNLLNEIRRACSDPNLSEDEKRVCQNAESQLLLDLSELEK